MKKQALSSYNTAAFSKAAHSYARHAHVQHTAAKRLAAHVPAGTYPVVVDIGCGQGLLTRLLGKKLQWQHYLALDNAPGMLRAFDAGGQDAKQGTVSTIAGDGEALPVAEGRADLLLSASAMQWYVRPGHSVPQAILLLRSGGYFGLSVFVKGTLCELAHVSQLTGFGSVLPLLSAQEYRTIVAGIEGIEYSSAEYTDVCVYPAVEDFLYSLKKTGVTGVRGVTGIKGVKETPEKRAVSTRTYQHFCEEYARLYPQNSMTGEGICATYRSLSLWGRVL